MEERNGLYLQSELPIKSVEFVNIKHTSATADNTCVPQTLSELEAAKGGSRTETDFKQKYRLDRKKA